MKWTSKLDRLSMASLFSPVLCNTSLMPIRKLRWKLSVVNTVPVLSIIIFDVLNGNKCYFRFEPAKNSLLVELSWMIQFLLKPSKKTNFKILNNSIFSHSQQKWIYTCRNVFQRSLNRFVNGICNSLVVI